MKPTNMGTGRVVGQFGVGVVDGPDMDDEPEVVPLSGSVTFTPSIPYLPNPSAFPNPITVMTAPIKAVLDEEGYLCTPEADGVTPRYRGVRLFATDDPDMSVENWTYSVAYRFNVVNGVTPAMKAHSISLPEGAEVDLTQVVEVPSSPGVGTPQALALLAQAEEAAANSGLAAAAAEAVALQLRADADAGVFKGDPGPAGPNTVPTDEFNAGLIQNPATATSAALSAAIETSNAQQVPPLVASAIAADGTVSAAAAAAVGTALDSSQRSFTVLYGAKKISGTASVYRGTPTYGTPARFGTALTSGLLRATLVCPDAEGFVVTIEAWVLAPDVPSINRAAFCFGGPFWVGAQASTGYAMMTVASAQSTRIISTKNICDGQWHHIAVSFTRTNGSTRIVQFFVDGVSHLATTPPTEYEFNEYLYIGGITTAGYDWAGSIDEVHLQLGEIYSKPFTPPTTPQVTGPRTLCRADFTSAQMDVPSPRDYAPRPVGASPGVVTYIGPVKPTDWKTDDRWVRNA